MAHLKETAIALIKTIESKSTEALAHIDTEKFIHHTVRKKDGFAGIWDFLMAAPGESNANPIRVIQDGNFVFLHTDFDFYGPHIGFDVFRFEDGKIVEMWDGIQAKAEPNVSGHTMIDGATEIMDLDKTEHNKKIVENFMSDVLVHRQSEKMEEYYHPAHYTEHNPQMRDGILKVTAQYDTVHKVLGEGNFVLTISEGYKTAQHCAFFDLFRIEDNKIVEHWDVTEPIAPKEEWKNTTGRF
jgi:predicted SnoaL-like aldol condensation-catalyzing enzyme